MTDKEKLEKLKKLADAMYYAAQYLTTDASRLHKAMDEYHQFIIHEYHNEEPVSEDLEEAAIQFATDTETGKVDVVKQSSFFWGAIYHKQQMMKNAKDGVITFDYYGDNDKIYGCIAHDSFSLEELGLKDGDKVKLIIIKEDKQ